MNRQASTLPGLEFGREQIATFALVAPVIEAFALERGLGVNRVFDRDPVMTYAAYFLSWEPKGQRCFIRIGALAPLVVGDDFEIAANFGWKHHRKWSYSSRESLARFTAILNEATLFVETALEAQASVSVGFNPPGTAAP